MILPAYKAALGGPVPKAPYVIAYPTITIIMKIVKTTPTPRNHVYPPLPPKAVAIAGFAPAPRAGDYPNLPAPQANLFSPPTPKGVGGSRPESAIRHHIPNNHHHNEDSKNNAHAPQPCLSSLTSKGRCYRGLRPRPASRESPKFACTAGEPV